MQVLAKQSFDGRKDSAWLASDGTQKTFTATCYVDPLNDPSLSIRVRLHAQDHDEDTARAVAKAVFNGPTDGTPLTLAWKCDARFAWVSVIASRPVTLGVDLSAA